MQYDTLNREMPDKTPVAIPLGYSAPETLSELIAKMVRNNDHLKTFSGAETPEEADDFDVDDDEVQFSSQHEFTEMQEDYLISEPEPTKEPQKSSEPEAKETSQKEPETEVQTV